MISSLSYDEWIQAFDGKVKKLVLIGATKEKIAAAAKKCGFFDIVFADSLEEAIQICYDNAKDGRCRFTVTCLRKLGYVQKL